MPGGCFAEVAPLAGGLYTNLACVLEHQHRYDDPLRLRTDGLGFTEPPDTAGAQLCMLAGRVTPSDGAGDWDTAIDEAEHLLFVRATERASRVEPLFALASVAARRGDRADVWTLLDEARGTVSWFRQIQYEAPVAVARAEVHLLEGHPEAAADELAPVYDNARRLGWSLDRVAAVRVGLDCRPATSPRDASGRTHTATRPRGDRQRTGLAASPNLRRCPPRQPRRTACCLPASKRQAPRRYTMP